VNFSRPKILGLCLLLMALFPMGAVAQVVITRQPQSQNVSSGATLNLSVEATGNGPLSYQWRVNGVNVPGATGPTLTITNFRPRNAGDYSVAVSDSAGAVNSDVARIRAAGLTALPFTDAMNDANTITGLSGVGSGSNVGATREAGEPNHAGKRGAHSVWLTWSPGLLGGVATFETAGSSFDTLLAVYTGDSVSGLTLVASNDDVNNCDDPANGFHTSKVRFNARGGTVYHIVVDGFEGDAGDIVLGWDVNLLEGLLSLVNILPTVTVGLPGDNLTLTASVQGLNLVSYQWYLNCQPIPNATQNILTITDLQASKVGNYTVRVRDLLTGGETLSDPVNIQINVVDGRTVDVSALDKFSETADSVRNAPAGNPARPQKASLGPSPIRKLSGGPVRGYRGTQVFSTVGATKDPGEPNHCGEAGGASVWYAYQPPDNGLLILDTDGSDFDTVMAVYTGPGTDFASLVPVTCDNNSGANGLTSKVMFQVTRDTVYYIAVDGVGGATGTAELDYYLGVAPVITQQTLTHTVPPGSDVTLTVAVSGNPAPACQWKFGQTTLDGATNSSLTITNFQSANQGYYWMVANNFAGTAYTGAITLLLDSPLRLDSFTSGGSGCSMRLIGQTNATYVIQRTSDFTYWTSLTTNTVPNGIWYFIDQGGVWCGTSFYRALTAP